MTLLPLCDKELSETVDSHIPRVICFKFRTDGPISDFADRFEKENNAKLSFVNSWAEFTTELEAVKHNCANTLVLLDSDLFNDNSSTISEILSTVSTLTRCIGCTTKIDIGITFTGPCSALFIKELHKSDVLGIVPCHLIFTQDKTAKAIQVLLSRTPYWPKDLIAELTSSSTIKCAQSSGIHLTSRQEQVLSLVCHRGLSNKKIANSLHISESTVKIHISAIMKVYGVRNRTQLALAASSSLKA